MKRVEMWFSPLPVYFLLPCSLILQGFFFHFTRLQFFYFGGKEKYLSHFILLNINTKKEDLLSLQNKISISNSYGMGKKKPTESPVCLGDLCRQYRRMSWVAEAES